MISPATAEVHAEDQASAPIAGRAWWDGAGSWVAVGLVVAVALVRFPNLPITGYTFDTGIQANLAQLTADGAVPLRDFEHGWNAGSWYLGALLWRIVGGNADLWWYVFTVGGTLVAGLSVLRVLSRRAVGQLWLLTLMTGWLALARVAHLKYAVPATVLAVLVWTWRRSTATARAVTVGMFAVVAVTHVELAVLLAAGLGLFELAASDRASPERAWAVAAAPVGVAVGLALEVAAYAAIGVPPGEVLRQLVSDQTVIDPTAHFGYPLLDPTDLRTAVLPALVLLPFLPAVWSSLHRITRLAACLQLTLVVICLRRTDPSHVAAATTLLPVVVGLAVLDVQGRLGALRSTGVGRIAWRWLIGGLVVTAATVVVGFTTRSLVAATALGIAAVAGIALSRWASPHAPTGNGHAPVARASWTASATLGGLFAGIGLLATSLVGHVAARAMALPGDVEADTVAAAIADPLARCTGGDPSVWVVPHPLGVYDRLDLVNPTPFVMFHYPFAREHDRVRQLVGAGEVPTILQYGPWLPSFAGLDAELEAAYTECARVDPPAVSQTVRVLRWNGS